MIENIGNYRSADKLKKKLPIIGKITIHIHNKSTPNNFSINLQQIRRQNT